MNEHIIFYGDVLTGKTYRARKIIENKKSFYIHVSDFKSVEALSNYLTRMEATPDMEYLVLDDVSVKLFPKLIELLNQMASGGILNNQKHKTQFNFMPTIIVTTNADCSMYKNKLPMYKLVLCNGMPTKLKIEIEYTMEEDGSSKVSYIVNPKHKLLEIMHAFTQASESFRQLVFTELEKNNRTTEFQIKHFVADKSLKDLV